MGRYSSTLEERSQEREKLLERRVDLAEREEKERQAMLAKDPAARAYALGAKPQELRRKRDELETKLLGVEGEIETLATLAAEERAQQSAKELQDRIAQAKKLTKREFDVYSRTGEPVAALVALWKELADVLEERDAFWHEMQSSDVLIAARAYNPEVAAEWDSTIAPPVQPCSVDLLVFVRKLIEASVDPRGDGYHDQAGEGKRVDTERNIARLLPDLTGERRTVSLSGRVEKAT
jgi:hypothetical protein